MSKVNFRYRKVDLSQNINNDEADNMGNAGGEGVEYIDEKESNEIKEVVEENKKAYEVETVDNAKLNIQKPKKESHYIVKETNLDYNKDFKEIDLNRDGVIDEEEELIQELKINDPNDNIKKTYNKMPPKLREKFDDKIKAINEKGEEIKEDDKNFIEKMMSGKIKI